MSSCLFWGSVQGVSWGSFFSILLIFIFRYSHTLHIRAFHVRYYRTPSFYWERTVSVCNMTLYSVFVLCVFPPHAFGGLYIFLSNHHGFAQLALGALSSYDTAPAPVSKGLQLLLSDVRRLLRLAHNHCLV